jgi:choline dehydrogenase
MQYENPCDCWKKDCRRCKRTRCVCECKRKRKRKCHHKCNVEKRDYVIVGGGTAGLTTGYLLNKDGKDVIVLEAGQDYDENPNILGAKRIGVLEGEFINEFFWNTQLKPNPNIPNNTDDHITGGRALGGSSTVNDQVYWRGTQTTFDQWGGLFADPDYVKNVFVSMETYSGSSQDPSARGTEGPFNVRQTDLTPSGPKLANALSNVLTLPQFGSRNVPVVEDFNVVDGPAISAQWQTWIQEEGPDTGIRQSTSISLLKERSSDLDYKTGATVLRVVFDSCGCKAVAVDYLHKNKVRRVYARKKLVLALGMRSATLLQHSGYGPKDLLEENGIKVIYDNPEVGYNLRNHVLITPVVSMPKEDNEKVVPTTPGGTALNKNLTMVSAIPAPSNPNDDNVDLEMIMINVASGVAAYGIILNNPASSGHMNIFTNDPLHPIIADVNSFSDPIDLQKMVEGVEIAKAVIDAIPGYNFITDLSDPEAFILDNARNIHHYTGVCAIGKVVDSHLNVKGVDNLMVADASVQFPTVKGHTYASSVLIGAVAYSEITGNTNVNFN